MLIITLDGAVAPNRLGNRSDRLRVVGMLNERRDGSTHPFVQRERAQESVKFRPGAGSIEAKNRRSPGADVDPPQPDEVPLVRQRLCRDNLGLLAVFDFGLGNTVRYLARTGRETPSSSPRCWPITAELRRVFPQHMLHYLSQLLSSSWVHDL